MIFFWLIFWRRKWYSCLIEKWKLKCRGCGHCRDCGDCRDCRDCSFCSYCSKVKVTFDVKVKIKLALKCDKKVHYNHFIRQKPTIVGNLKSVIMMVVLMMKKIVIVKQIRNFLVTYHRVADSLNSLSVSRQVIQRQQPAYQMQDSPAFRSAFTIAIWDKSAMLSLLQGPDLW